jgi:prephenate dehydrogenase
MADSPSFSPIDVLAIVGVGLIGGSFAAALRKAGRVKRVLGVGRRPGPLVQAKQLGLIDEAVSLEEAARRADVILLAAPVGTMPALFRGLAPHLKDTTLVTDAGSTKADVVNAAYEALGQRVGQFVPGHPIAGAEKTGPEFADALAGKFRFNATTAHSVMGGRGCPGCFNGPGKPRPGAGVG